MVEAVEWDVEKIKDKFNRWRTANPQRPILVYHAKLILYLLLQLIEWPIDVVMAVWLLKTDHYNTGVTTSIFTIAPQLIISLYLVSNSKCLKVAEPCMKPITAVLIFPFYFIGYLFKDVLMTVWVFIVEVILLSFGLLSRMCCREQENIRMPDQQRRQILFYRGVFEFWFQSLPQFVIRLVVALRQNVIKREFLWLATFVAGINVLVHGTKVIRFRSETKLTVFKPALHYIKAGFTVFRGSKALVFPRVTVTCTLEEFPWVDFYNDIYEEMIVTGVPGNGFPYFKHICRLASRTYALRKIEAINCEISDAGPLSISYLTEAMRSNHGMKEINLSRNSLHNEGAGHIADMLRNNCTLEVLDLAGNRMGLEGIRYINGALRAHNTYLRTLILNQNAVGEQGGESFGQLLGFNSTLETLSVRSCNIGDVGVAGLGRGLGTNISLKSIDLSDNNIGPEGAKSLGEALKENKTLKVLKLADNAFTNAGVEHICLAFDENFSTEELDLSNCGLTEPGAQHIGNMLYANNTLQTLQLGSNRLGDAGAVLIVKSLSVNSTLRCLGLQNNWIGDIGALALAKFLEADSDVSSLSLDGNHGIGDTGATALTGAISSNRTLESLSFTWKKSVADQNKLIEGALNKSRENGSHLCKLEVELIVNRENEGKSDTGSVMREKSVYVRPVIPTARTIPDSLHIDMEDLLDGKLTNDFYCTTITNPFGPGE